MYNKRRKIGENKEVMTLENLTQSQKIAIEGEVAKMLITAKHNAEILYRLYTIMKSVPKDVSLYILEAAKEILSIDDLKLNRLLLEVSNDDFPYWVWLERTAADLKLSVTMAAAEGMMCMGEIDKKLAQQMIIKSAFTYYCRTIASINPAAALKLCHYILDEESLSLGFLSEVCFELIADLSELLCSKDKLDKKVFHSSFDIQDMLSFSLETRILSDLDKMEKKKTTKRKKVTKEKQVEMEDERQLRINPVETGVDNIKAFTIEAPINGDLEQAKAIANTVNDVISKLLNEQISKKPPVEHEKYAVVKRFKGEKDSLTIKICDSPEEAEDFIRTIKKEYPTMYKNCEITIEKVK